MTKKPILIILLAIAICTVAVFSILSKTEPEKTAASGQNDPPASSSADRKKAQMASAENPTEITGEEKINVRPSEKQRIEAARIKAERAEAQRIENERLAAEAAAAPKKDFPNATRLEGRSGYVSSPYNQKIIDVREIPPGTLVQDPTFPPEEKKYFRVPAE